MALVNAFGAISLEATQQAVLAELVLILAKLNASIAVTGPLTDTQLRAALVPVTGPLTDTQLRATAVAVSGPLTLAQLNATAVNILGTVAVSNAFGLESTQLLVKADLDGIKSDLDERYSGGKTALGVTVSAAGDNTILTPPLGQSLRMVWCSAIPSTDNLAANLVKFKFGAGGTPFYQAYALAHWEVFTGGVNVPLVVNTATAEPVSITVHYRVV